MSLTTLQLAEYLGRPADILVVDDNPVDLRLFRELLRAYSCTVVEACCGEDALAIAGQKRLDLVLLDLKMPSMSGIEVMQRLKVTHPQLPVVVVSGYLHEYEANEILKFGGVLTCIRKPIRSKDFAPLFHTLKIRAVPVAKEAP